MARRGDGLFLTRPCLDSRLLLIHGQRYRIPLGEGHFPRSVAAEIATVKRTGIFTE